MILPIYTYGQPGLRQKTRVVSENTPELQELIDSMIETMQNAQGVGLAAPQVGRRERLFVVDLTGLAEELAEENDGKVPFYAQEPLALINPEIVEVQEEPEVEFEEGCLSIPGIVEYVTRPDRLRVRFMDRDFNPHEMPAEDLFSRVFQHELDHLDGVLFIDRLSPLKKRMLKRRLREMAQGDVEAEYPLEVPA
ncbi:MAG: peptide deformylase [Rubricoccaceae bacterium]|nr:peptide deformylase [Rubricoccaceae bacterium]